ncbi:glycosyltransferase [Serratia sp. SRS-8-S-2018]|nr:MULTISPECIES: glycosyltransferase family 4 protein [Serratia]EJC6392698.1 glycosyltransferase family 4 protein [Serratia marcescens]MDY7607696.1 glycosyltransferase family 4 protein [Serratia marcescens]OZT19120.1 hypothetical protein CHR54_00855 [Serratia marcescens]QPJ90863.1 glycosyltransferase family 4 protein [Serratia marcescens]RZF17479.1 hypothetical protein B7L62_06915 [Serratia marcescens]
MKILIVNTIYAPFKVGGAEVSVQLLAEELVKNGHSVLVVTLHDKANKEKATINGVNVHYLPLKNIYWPFSNDGEKRKKWEKIAWHIIDNYNFKMARLFSEELDSFKPDIVHTNNICGFSVSIWKEIKKRDIKLIHTSRDYYLFHPSSTLYSRNKNINVNALSVKLWSFFKRSASHRVDTYVGISDFIKTFHINNGFFKRDSAFYIYNAVNRPDYQSDKGNKTRFGFIGRLTRDKGFDDYCEFASNNPDAVYYAAGRFPSGKEGDELKRLAEKSNIKLMGFISIDEFFSQVDVAFLPVKWREPFGRVVVECVFANKIVLTNAVGGISELAMLLPNIYFIDKGKDVIAGCAVNEVTNEQLTMFSQDKITLEYLSVYLHTIRNGSVN